MKQILLIFALFTSVLAHSQSLDDQAQEEMANFRSVLVDYEIHNDKLVGLIKKNREYFIYFTDSKGAKLFESFEIFFPTDLEIDCMGNLFVVGLDSAFQIDLTDYVTRVQSLDIATYKSNIQNCRAYFNETLVRAAPNNAFIYEPISDSMYVLYPVVGTVQVWAEHTGVKTYSNKQNMNAMNDEKLQENRKLNLKNDGFSNPYPSGRQQNGRFSSPVTGTRTSILSVFQKGDTLYVVDETDDLFLIYSEYGESGRMYPIKGLSLDSRFEQDRQTQEVYVMTTSVGNTTIHTINQFGELKIVGSLYKGLTKGDLKFSNGFLYFRDSKGAGESIRRVKLN